MNTNIFRRQYQGTDYKTRIKWGLLIIGLLGCAQMSGVYAKGGTAKPPRGAIAPFVVPTLPTPTPTGGTWAGIHGFDVTGFITDASDFTITVNSTRIKIPDNMIVQMPANTLSWDDVHAVGYYDAVNNITYPSLLDHRFEAHVVGNIVNGEYIAGLIYISQSSAAVGSGFISEIDYSDGSIYVSAAQGVNEKVRLRINDPFGRFGRVHSPDPRFSVDDANPTIHSGTGYPMCVPRTDPVVEDDALCPQKNRPKVLNGCRNFSQAGIPLPVSGELSPPIAGQEYCSQFVMKAVPGTPSNAIYIQTTGNQAGPNDPDARQQAPFQVGDFISYSGTYVENAEGVGYFSVHTIEANVGIFTQAGTQPAYLAIGEFGVGTADPTATAVNGAAQETQDRIFLEAATTDVRTPVDIFMVEVNPTTGAPSYRWVTPYEMTGECNPATTLAATCLETSGGITTQYTGPQNQRARIRAAKAIAGMLSAPTRNMVVMQRTTCPLIGTPLGGDPPRTYNQAAFDTCVNAIPLVANGLKAGFYAAPVFEFIFGENAKAGDPIIPNDLWHLPFIVYGEGPDVGPLSPTPW
ncbi:hypothetical protein [Nitrosomonas supralitoralis]|uniref:Uncharacterized protein n=1 Tax=Nitrosomonas supralitoralis TaxID=2116706 RepID=A0A2P7NYQ5_9PROT|nr:hypothetical protein [Nitrosomonas supralitoralis]PSJ18557.1 hypothetical protein C7H79_01805 [Nitrosomonas supralitoralis]